MEAAGFTRARRASETGLGWQSSYPRRRNSLFRDLTATSSVSGMFGPGIGWDISPGSPSEQLTVGQTETLSLIDDQGKDVSASVEFGDVVTHVDEIAVANLSRGTVEKMLAGARNSTVTVCFFNVKTRTDYVLELRRHTPYVEGRRQSLGASGPPLFPRKQAPNAAPVDFEVAGRWTDLNSQFEVRKFLDLMCRDGFVNQNPMLHNVPISELMKSQAPDDRGTLGLRIAMSMDQTDLLPTQIEAIVPGSLAHTSGMLYRGDNIVAIDGMRVNELNIISVIKETNVIGAPCCLTIARAGHECEIPLVRSSALRLQQSDDLLGLVEELEQIIRKSENSSLMTSKIEALKNAIVEMEQRNCRSDGFMYNQLAQLSRKAEDNKESVDKSKAKIKEDVEKKMVEMAMKMEELAGSLEVARNQRDDLEGDEQGQKCIDSEKERKHETSSTDRRVRDHIQSRLKEVERQDAKAVVTIDVAQS